MQHNLKALNITIGQDWYLRIFSYSKVLSCWIKEVIYNLKNEKREKHEEEKESILNNVQLQIRFTLHPKSILDKILERCDLIIYWIYVDIYIYRKICITFLM